MMTRNRDRCIGEVKNRVTQGIKASADMRGRREVEKVQETQKVL